MQGKTINGFTLQNLLGTGGMAEVWYAENKIGKKAAVKLLLPKFCNDEVVVARFENEAKVMVKLNHPNIRQAYDYGSIDGRPAIVMEYLEGNDLKSRMKREGCFTSEELVKWWNQIVDALNYTHTKGIVHRDIKPSNIFLDKNGSIKLLDFGIAKIKESISMTQTGAMMGTLMYMSPEQVEDSKHIGPESDIYSLAVTFVHLLTGKAPYDSTSSDYAIRKGIVEQPLDLSLLPNDWQVFLAPYLAKEPAKRPTLKHFDKKKKDAEDDETEGGRVRKPTIDEKNNGGIGGGHLGFSKKKKTLIKILIVILGTPILSWAIVFLPDFFSNLFKNINNRNKYTSVCSIYVSGNDVYAAGSVCSGSSTTDVPILWKNGVMQKVGNKGNFNKATSVFVSGDDVYVSVSDHEERKAILWKNGETQILGEGEANCVAVFDDDVYVVGYIDDNPLKTAVIWKNGNMIKLGIGVAESVFVSNNGDVLAAGYIGDGYTREAVLYKNGEVERLGKGRATSVVVSGNGDVYIVGTSGHGRDEKSVLWKNGEMMSLQDLYGVYSVSVSENDQVCIVGSTSSGAVALIDGVSYQIEKVEDEVTSLAYYTAFFHENKIYIGGNSKDGVWSVWKCELGKGSEAISLERVEVAKE